MQQSKIATPLMLVAALLLAAFGISQFGGVSFTAEEHDEEHGEEGDERDLSALPPELRARIAAEYDGRIVEVERERENGREVYEIKIVDADGRKREVLVDPQSGELSEE